MDVLHLCQMRRLYIYFSELKNNQKVACLRNNEYQFIRGTVECSGPNRPLVVPSQIFAVFISDSNRQHTCQANSRMAPPTEIQQHFFPVIIAMSPPQEEGSACLVLWCVVFELIRFFWKADSIFCESAVRCRRIRSISDRQRSDVHNYGSYDIGPATAKYKQHRVSTAHHVAAALDREELLPCVWCLSRLGGSEKWLDLYETLARLGRIRASRRLLY